MPLFDLGSLGSCDLLDPRGCHSRGPKPSIISGPSFPRNWSDTSSSVGQSCSYFTALARVEDVLLYAFNRTLPGSLRVHPRLVLVPSPGAAPGFSKPKLNTGRLCFPSAIEQLLDLATRQTATPEKWIQLTTWNVESPKPTRSE